jgi:hypothetical protein
MSVVIFHPSVAPFVQQAARALDEAGLLGRFYTTLRHDPTSVWQRAACATARLGGRDLQRQLARRAVTEVPAHLVTSFPFREVIRLAAGPLDQSGRLADLIWEWSELGFDRAVARRLPAGVQAVYGFEHSSRTTFEAARARGIRTIYDVPAPETTFVQQMLEREIARFPELRTPYHTHTHAREERRTERRRAEWHAADLVIANSEFTKRSYVAAGLDGAKVRVVPYGAPPVTSSAEASPIAPRGDQPLQLLWAGTFGIRKGAHYLLDAWRRHRLGVHAELRIHGAVTLPESLLRRLPAGVELAGSIPRSELLEAYRRADALVFPTLCDGFGLVVTEAFSCGLPVITTHAAGAADLVQPQVNGLIVPPGDSDALAEAIHWCLDHRDAVAAMRGAALATAEKHQWSDYRHAIAAQVAAGCAMPNARSAQVNVA